MDFSIARQTIEYLLNDREHFNDPSVIWDFIGGEPFLEVELIDEITDYAKRRMYELDHPWFNNYRMSFSTNGLLYDDPRVQRYISKNLAHLSIGITIDGTKAKHDLQRVYPNGNGSYDDVIRNVPLWLSQFPNSSTKVTVSHADIPFICESVLHLWSLGIPTININVVYENVWQDGDDIVFEKQLVKIADHAIENRLFEKRLQCSFFTEHVGCPLDPVRDNQNWCGAGKMVAVDGRGDFYPCVRFAPFSLAKRKPIVIGNCRDGIDFNKLRPFLVLNRTSQSSKECTECEIAGGCAWCQGLNYDESDTGTIYQRATFICNMHKARVRANKYYWEKFSRLSGQKRLDNRIQGIC